MSWSFYFFVVKLIGGRYLLFAGLAFILAYFVFRKHISFRKIQQRYPKSIDYIREIGFSLTTIAIFSLIPLLFIRNPAIRVHTNYYTDINQHGLFYFIIAFPIMLFLHDTYFYWAHRLMHHPALFRIFHLVHHKSVNPSPWAAYAFHPLEAIVEGGIVILFLFTIPIHTYHLPFFFLFMIVYNVYGHMGWELYPKGFNRHWLGRWVNTAVNHNQHHQYFKGNYGLYFLFWDRIMGTIREDYDQHYDEVKSRSKNNP
ncbi:MAG: sterol desaturase family protein [Chitinophagaceae bacterium]|nr:sterol desaturase family protein [Chitinophagaceae bacterium]